jgi:integrase/recombinase XerD
MAAKQVTLYVRVSLPGGKRPYLDPVYAANKKLKEGWAVLDGKPQRFADAAYYLRYLRNGKRVFERIGTRADDASAAKIRTEIGLQASANGIEIATSASAPIAPTTTDIPEGRSLAQAITEYLEEIKDSKKPSTYEAYEIALRYFTESCTKTYLEDIDRKDMLAFSKYLSKKRKQSQRSTWNKFSNVMGFLKVYGIVNILRTGDWPEYTLEDPEIYEPEQLSAFFAACSDKERLPFEFFLMSGMREQEVMHTCWPDVSFAHGSVKVSAKPKYGWTPKGYKGRTIPVPASLLDDLKAMKPKKLRGLVFGDSGSDTELRTNLLECCKAIAKRAGLDPGEWWLHKFRSTFATMHLRAGVDLRTVQAWMGHTDIASTMRYLQPAQGAAVQQKVNATFSAFGGVAA